MFPALADAEGEATTPSKTRVPPSDPIPVQGSLKALAQPEVVEAFARGEEKGVG